DADANLVQDAKQVEVRLRGLGVAAAVRNLGCRGELFLHNRRPVGDVLVYGDGAPGDDAFDAIDTRLALAAGYLAPPSAPSATRMPITPRVRPRGRRRESAPGRQPTDAARAPSPCRTAQIVGHARAKQAWRRLGIGWRQQAPLEDPGLVRDNVRALAAPIV